VETISPNRFEKKRVLGRKTLKKQYVKQSISTKSSILGSSVKNILIISIIFMLAACANTKRTDIVSLKEQSACQGYAIMAEELAEYRDSGLDAEKAFFSYINEHNPPKSLQVHTAFMSKAIQDNSDIKKETFHYIYSYACLASMKGVSFKVSTPYLIGSGRRCEDNNKRETMISGCIQMAYIKLLDEAP
jgi:hypothetical protein